MNPCVNNEHGSCVSCLKKIHSLFDDLSADELALLNSHRTVVNYDRGELIYKAGTRASGLLCLNAGKVKVVRSGPKGTEQIIALKRPVDFIDLRALLNDSPYSNSAIALEDSSVCIMDKTDFMNVLLNNPSLTLKFMRLFINELNSNDEHMGNITQKHLRARLADAVFQLEGMYGYLPDGQTINCLIKRADLAGLSNMTTANVIRTLSAFAKEGLVVTRKKRLVIQNKEGLLEVSRN